MSHTNDGSRRAASVEGLKQIQEHTVPTTPTLVPDNVSKYLTSLYSLHGKTALITGATRGLGRQIAIAIASAGADLIILVRSPTDPNVHSLQSLITSLGRRLYIHTADLSNRSTYLNLISAFFDPSSSTPYPTIFIHSAGLQHRCPATTFPESQWDSILEVNLTSGFLISRLLAKHWLDILSPSSSSSSSPFPSSFPSGSQPSILFVASILSRGPGSQNIPAYISAKGGVSQLVKGLSNEWAKHGIRVNAVAPGYFATELTSGIKGEAEREMLGRVPMGRWGRGRVEGQEGDGQGEIELGDLEGMAVALVGRGAEFVSGEMVIVDGGYSGR